MANIGWTHNALWGNIRPGRSFATYVVAGVISALFGIVGYFHLVPQYEIFLLNGRSKGLFKDCNVYGPFFVPIVLIAINLLLEAGQKFYEDWWP